MISHDSYPVEPWSVRETSLDLDVLAQSESIFALTNGHLGLRGNLDEGEPRALSGTYLNGFYESHPIAYGESGYGYPEDGQTVVNVTDGKLIRLLVEDEPLDVHRGTLERHERALDLRAGTLERTLRWRSAAGRTVDVRSTRLVSFRDRNIAAISYEVEAVEEPYRVAVQSNLLANQRERHAGSDPRAGADLGAVLDSRLHTHDGLRAVLAHTTRSSGLSMAAGMEHVVDAKDAPLTRTECEPDLGRVTMSAEVSPGSPLRVVKLLAYHWSSEESVEWLRDQVDASLENALAIGFEGFADAQRVRLDQFWEVANVELAGDDEIQQAIRFALFQLFQASVRAETRAIPAKGLTGPGYDGHAFWDTEGYVLPVLTYSAPEHARDALLWRHSTLDLARQRASELGLRGATFPWRTIHGEECSGYWPAGTAAFHVNADIADAVRRYVHATGDVEFERGPGLELLVETARLWASLGHHGADGAFHISGVTGPDEYSAIVDDNVYTNLMAERNLSEAADAAERHEEAAERLAVDDDEIAAWRNAADVVHVPFDERLGVHSQDADFTGHARWDFSSTAPDDYPLLLNYPYFEIYRKQVVKQADLVMALFTRGDAFTAEEKRRAFDYYEALTVRDSSLSACVQSVVAAEVGHMDLAYDYLAEAALMDLHDLEHNVLDGVHIASLGGALIALVAGIAGMRHHGSGIAFAPRLPDGLEHLAFAVGFRGRRLQVEVAPAEATYLLSDDGESLQDSRGRSRQASPEANPKGLPLSDDGESLQDSHRIEHWGDPLELGPGEYVTRPIPSAPAQDSPEQPAGRAPPRRRGRA